MTILTAVAEKPTAESKLGIAFSRANAESPLVIKMIREDGLFATTDLKAGMLVDSVMGIPMMFATPKSAADTLRLADAGQVEVKVLVNIGEVTKTSPKQKLGISMKNSTTKSGIFISNIGVDGLFAETELKEGDKVLYINDIPCPETTKDAIALVKGASSILKIIAVPTDITPPTEEELAEQQAKAAMMVPEDEVEEKKEEEDVTLNVVEDENTAVVEQDKGLIEKVFKACIC